METMVSNAFPVSIYFPVLEELHRQSQLPPTLSPGVAPRHPEIGSAKEEKSFVILAWTCC